MRQCDQRDRNPAAVRLPGCRLTVPVRYRRRARPDWPVRRPRFDSCSRPGIHARAAVSWRLVAALVLPALCPVARMLPLLARAGAEPEESGAVTGPGTVDPWHARARPCSWAARGLPRRARSRRETGGVSGRADGGTELDVPPAKPGTIVRRRQPGSSIPSRLANRRPRCTGFRGRIRLNCGQKTQMQYSSNKGWPQRARRMAARR